MAAESGAWLDSVADALAELADAIREVTVKLGKFYENLKAALGQAAQKAKREQRRCRTRKVQTVPKTNAVPLGTSTYLYKAKQMENLARSVKTRTAPKKGHKKIEQCQHTFRITSKRCAPCDGYNKECEEYSVAHDPNG